MSLYKVGPYQLTPRCRVIVITPGKPICKANDRCYNPGITGKGPPCMVSDFVGQQLSEPKLAGPGSGRFLHETIHDPERYQWLNLWLRFVASDVFEILPY